MSKQTDALEAVLLFYTVGLWDEQKKLRWMNLTGKDEATTKVLCDTVRAALSSVSSGGGGGSENLPAALEKYNGKLSDAGGKP